MVDSLADEIYAGSRNRLYHTIDGGKHWSFVGELPVMTLIKQIIPIDSHTILINASSDGHGNAYISFDSGKQFSICLQHTAAGSALWFDRRGNKLFAACYKPFSVQVSSDTGCHWTALSRIDTLKRPHVCSLCVFAESGSNKLLVSCSQPPAIYFLDSSATTWRKIFRDPKLTNRELPVVTLWGKTIAACLTSATASADENIYLSSDQGLNWKAVYCPFSIWGAGFDRTNKTIWTGAYGPFTPTYGPTPSTKDTTSLRYTDDFGQTWTGVSCFGARLFWQFDVLPNGNMICATDAGLLCVKKNEPNN